jgi:hypothetical protein
MKLPEAICSVCITKQHEFVIYGARCVAVRERDSGQWIDEHHAIDERVSLVPTLRRHTDSVELALWDLSVHAFGFQIQIGPVLAVSKPDHATREHIATLPRYGTRILSSMSFGVGAAEPG